MHMLRSALLVMMLASVVSFTSAQNRYRSTNEAQANNNVKAWVKEFLRDYKLDAQATPQDIDQIASLKVKAESLTATLTERQAVYKELIPILYRLGGITRVATEQELTQIAQSVAQATQRTLPTCEVKPISSATTPPGQLGHVEKSGRGPIPMILIPDLFADWTLYQGFMQRNQDRYTMYAVTLPGEGGTPPPARPASTDLMTTPWWDNAEQAIVKLIEKNKLNKVVVVGTQASVYLAARLALDHPDKIRGAVLLNGLVAPVMRINDRPYTKEERLRSKARGIPTTVMLSEFAPLALASRACAEQVLKNLSSGRRTVMSFTTRQAERAEALFINGLMTSDPRTYRYTFELQNTDLTEDLQKLTVPMLAIPTVFDKDSSLPVSNGLNQWGEIKALYPSIPLTFAPFEGTRLYVSEDAPQELDQAIAAFLAGKPVEVKHERIVAVRASPRAEVKQVIGTTDIDVVYGRPQVKERKIWGTLVPYNRVWRSGADEATTISFSTDVLIEGQKLPAGTYSFFTIPTESEWTIIFNKVPRQWGAFFYNPEVDALRIKLKPQTTEHQEWLSYRFESLSPTSAQMILRWEKISLPIKIELEPSKPAGR